MSPDPIHYATYFDRHYLTRGLALHCSLLRHSPPFVLWILCLDDDTHETLARLRLTSVELIRLAELERADPALPAVKATRGAVEYYWTCGPPLLLYILARQPGIERLAYVDADLYFFDDPTPLCEELATGSILLTEHRFSAAARASGSTSGSRFNVGLVLFRTTAPARACLRRWREQCLEWCFDRFEPDRYGDQRYLDDWPERYDGVVITRHLGAGLAPWNLGTHPIRAERGRVLVAGDPLVHYHFARFRVITPRLYEPMLWHFGQRLEPAVKRHIYVPYVRELRRAGKLLRAAGARVDPVDTVRRKPAPEKHVALRRMLRHRSFLVVTDSFAV